MKKYLLLSLFIVHLFMLESYARDENTDRISREKNMESQGILASSSVEHTFFIFHETTNIVITVQAFTLRFHFGRESSDPDLFYKRLESSFFQSSRVLTSRVDSKTRFTKLHFLQI